MSAELFRLMTGTELLHIPYKGSGQADGVSGRVSMMFENMPGAVGHIKAGKVGVLAVTGLQRTPALPDVKTVAESGVPGYESLSWSGIAAPAATPPEVIARLNKEINAILTSPDMRQKLTEQGAEAVVARGSVRGAHQPGAAEVVEGGTRSRDRGELDGVPFQARGARSHLGLGGVRQRLQGELPPGSTSLACLKASRISPRPTT